MELNLPAKLQRALEREATDARKTLHAHVVRKLERVTPLVEYIRPERLHEGLPKLVALLNEYPGVSVIHHEVTSDAYWWVKFLIDIEHPRAWQVVQLFAHIFNEISIHERLPTVFKPTSPPPNLNGGPDEALFWVIESTFNYIDPQYIADALRAYGVPRDGEDEPEEEEVVEEPYPIRPGPPPLPVQGPPPLPSDDKKPWWKLG